MTSIIITAYNVEAYIEQAIRSALEQTYEDIEVIVVLDKPTDNTEAIVKAIAAEDNRVRIVGNEKNVGAGLSRRYGLKEAKGEFTLLLDGDDFLRPTFIADLIAKAEETDADIVSGGIEVLRENGVRDITLYGEQVTEGYGKVVKFWGERIVFMNNKLIRRELHDKVPYCHRRYIEDTPVIIPQLWYANKVAYVDNAGYVYRMQPNSLTHTTNPIKDVIFKGLCWCDLMDFFNANDPEFLNHFPLKSFVANTLESLNKLELSPDNLNPYGNEWAELTMRLFNIVDITGVDFKKVEPSQVGADMMTRRANTELFENYKRFNKVTYMQVAEGLWFLQKAKCACSTLSYLCCAFHGEKDVKDEQKQSFKYKQGYRPNGNIAMVWRDPVERFISAYTDKYSDLEHASRWAAAKGLVGKSVDEVLDYIEQLYAEGVEPMDIDEHLRKQSDYSEDVENVHVIVPIEKLDAFLATHGVKTARRNVSQRQKVILSTDQVERVKALYAKDYELLTLDKVWKNKQ